MMKELNKGIKMLKYSYGYKGMWGCAVFLIVIGLSLQLLPNSDFWLFGGYFILISAMFPTQMVYTISVSNMIQTSSSKKALQTSIPTLVNVGGTIFLYLLYVLISGIRIWMDVEKQAVVSTSVFVLAMLAFVLLIYSAVSFKYFVLSSIFMTISIYIGMGFVLNYAGERNLEVIGNLSFTGAILLGICIMLVGGIIAYLLSKLVYKVPISKLSQMAPLRKYM